jgi:hypothetical protein
MFGNGINCRSCKHYGGTISDGNILCMENGPLIDVSYCEKYKYEECGEKISEINETKTSNCLLCNYFSKHTSEKVKNFGECSKFPGRLYNGGKRNSCGFYKKRCTT